MGKYSYPVLTIDGWRSFVPGKNMAENVEEIEAKLREAVDLYLSYFRDRGQPAPPANASVGRFTAA